MGQRGGSSKIQLFAESEMNFFSKVVNVQIDFDKDENGAVTHLVFHQSGREQKAIRTKVP